MNISKFNKVLTRSILSLTMIATLVPNTVFAASSSGSTSGGKTNTISTSKCTGSSSLSGTDAAVFYGNTDIADLVCVKSDGFKTTAEGTNNIQNYHWTAWYKDSKDANVDATLGTGNYYGFTKDKVNAWKQYEDEVRELNNGKFPKNKDYIYPTDTNNGKLDFWGDIAGYYSILGDPQYSTIKLEAYQQFSYRTEHVSETPIIWTDASYNPPENKGDDSNSKPTTKPQNNTNKGNGNSGSGTQDDDLDYWVSCHQFLCADGSVAPDYGIPGVKAKPREDGPSAFDTSSSNPPQTSNWPGGPNYHDTRSSDMTYDLGNGLHLTIRTTTTTNYGTKLIKVAEANVAANAYATEIAAYGKLNLVPGANTTKTYDVGRSGFWKTTPTYWSDGGKLTINNNSNYAYGFVRESENSNGVNKVNLYKLISQKDKLYDVVHGYKYIPDAICKTRCHPADDGDDDDNNDETPPANIELDIKEDEPQSETELSKFVHLEKSPD